MPSKVILITGANRGIGNAIIKSLAMRFPEHDYILTARTLSKAQDAVTQLQNSGVTGRISALELDITSDMSIAAAVDFVRDTFGLLDVLVNNAAVARFASSNRAADRQAFAETFDTNVTSVHHTVLSFLPLLKLSANVPLIVNVSSARGSLTWSANGELPPTEAVSYSISKAALNSLTLEWMKKEQDMRFYAINPGHCRTGFNSSRGKREPEEGANVVIRLVEEEGKVDGGFYETIGSASDLVQVPW